MDEILNLIESVSEGFPTYSFLWLSSSDMARVTDEACSQNFFECVICSQRNALWF